MDQRPQKIAPFDINRLYDFLDGLQAGGFDVDARHYIALSDMLLSLAARGEKLNEISLKTLVAPIICSSPSEQEAFYSRFEQWYPTIASELEGASLHEFFSSSGQAKKSTPLFDIRLLLTRSLGPIAAAISAIGATIVAISAIAQIDFQNTPIPYFEIIIRYAFWFLFVGLAGWIGWFVWNQYRENQFITRESASEEPIYTSIPVAAHFHDALPVIQFKPVVSALRRRTHKSSHEVDVEQTIERALIMNKWLKFVYRQRKVMPEYVVLIDRKSRLDQQARFVQEVLNRLAADGVWLHQYEFSGDPRLCFPLDKKDTPLHLKDLQARYPEARLLVFSGANEFINPLTGQLQNWIEPLTQWSERAIITPDKVQRALQEELQARDFAVLPMSLTGLAAIVRAFEVDNANFERETEPQFPHPLTDRPTRWTGRDAPPHDEVTSLLADVKVYLGETGFFWLCATAIYPELRWELTLHLGNELKDVEGRSILSPEGLVRLIYLPWFRYGYMPDWMRTTLIEQLAPEQENQVRNVLQKLLSSAYVGEGFDLVFSRSRNESLGKRTRRFIDALIRNAPSDSQLKDYIFIKFISSNRLRRLAVEVPQIWNDIKGINPIWVLGSSLISNVWNFIRETVQRPKDFRSQPGEKVGHAIWQARLLDAIADLGEDGRAAADFLRRQKIKIRFRRTRSNIGAYWTTFRGIFLNSYYYSYVTPLDDLRLLTIIIHEARQLQQGWITAMSVYGELDAWQTEFRVYERVKGKYPHPAIAELMRLPLAYDRAVLRKALELMQAYAGKGYRADLLPLFPIGKEIRYWIFRTQPERPELRDSLSRKRSSTSQESTSVKIFISYSRKDIGFVRKLAKDLEMVGYDIWWDLSDLQGGDDWLQAIPEAIAASQYFIVILTPNSRQSEWVEKEYIQALNLRKKIIPIMLQQTQVPFALNTLQYADFANGTYASNFDTLLTFINQEERVGEYLKASQTYNPFRSLELLNSPLPMMKAAYSDRMAWIMSVMAKLAYIEFEANEEELKRLEQNLKSGNFEIIRTFSQGSTQAFLARNQFYAVLAFRGTAPGTQQDVQADIRVYKRYSKEGRIFPGYDAVYEAIEGYLANSDMFHKNNLPLYIAGHSLGGSLAVITAQRLEKQFNEVAACYTYGSPRIAINVIDRNIKTKIYRIVHSIDIITLTPSIGYVHVGEPRFIASTGSVYKGIPFFRRYWEMVMALLPLWWGRWVATHDISVYRDKLERIAKESQ